MHTSAHQKTVVEDNLVDQLEKVLEVSEEQVVRLRKEIERLTCLAERYRMDWILENRRAEFAEREIHEDSDYWAKAWSYSQPRPNDASPPRLST